MTQLHQAKIGVDQSKFSHQVTSAGCYSTSVHSVTVVKCLPTSSHKEQGTSCHWYRRCAYISEDPLCKGVAKYKVL